MLERRRIYLRKTIFDFDQSQTISRTRKWADMDIIFSFSQSELSPNDLSVSEEYPFSIPGLGFRVRV